MKPAIILYFRFALFLTGLNLAACRIPGLMPKLSRFGAATLFAVYFAAYALQNRDIQWDRRIAVLPVSLFLILFEPACFSGIALFFFGLTAINQSGKISWNREFTLFAATTLLYACFLAFYSISPYLWHTVQTISVSVSRLITSAAGSEMTLGASAMGTPVFISAVCLCISDAITRRRPQVIFGGCVALIAVHWIYPPAAASASGFFEKYAPALDPAPMYLQFLLPALLAVPIVIQHRRWTSENRQSDGRSHPMPRVQVVIPCAMCFLASAVLFWNPAAGPEKGEILFLDKGTDWSVPAFNGRYGQHSAGMFGMLPEYLKMRGVEARIIESPFSRDAYPHACVLAVFNPSKEFSGTEIQSIHEFVRQGGGLLIAGDHTDVNGVMGPINELLGPFPVKLNFDTALPLTSGWARGLERFRHEINQSIRYGHDTGIWVGAGLTVFPPARPLIAGRAGWADKGDYTNRRRAYLGDYKRGPEEQLSDIPLAAEYVYGRGKIILFGDTSPFQNGVLASTYPFVDGVFHHLKTPASFMERWSSLKTAAALLILAGALYIAHRRGAIFVLIGCIICFEAGMNTPLLTETAVNYGSNPASGLHPSYPSAYIDTSRIGRYSPFASSDNSIWGLQINLMRNGYIPLETGSIAVLKTNPPDLFFEIAPVKSFSPDKIETIRAYMENGGICIWAVGWEDADGSRNFLNAFGIEIDAVPLGPAEIRSDRMRIQFVEAWPVQSSESAATPLVQKWGRPVILEKPVGCGKLVVIGDSRFFHNRNLESYQSYDIWNIHFLKHLLAMLKRH